MSKQYNAIIQREEDLYVALCPELDVVSQGASVFEARENLREAIELFLEAADPAEIRHRMHEEQYISSVEVSIG
ncbi:MAG: type II toxin-antitoxin system HicB family antitoxin [Bacteroidales bacterium]|jgi:predicted RNase H-like HicB family nuclease|nr:type II toxin-antitoxin system HicB family antitoxin [Bacteroidales bacterium]